MNAVPSVRRTLNFGYFQQLVAMCSLLGFHLLVPLVTGLETFGRFTLAFGLVMLVTSLAGSSLDLVIARDIRAEGLGIRRQLFWRSLAVRITVCGLLAGLAFLPASPLRLVSEQSGVGPLLICATILSAALSSHCIATIIGMRATGKAFLLSALQVFPYVLLPLVMWWLEGTGARALMEGFLISNVLMVVAELWVLQHMTWTAATSVPNAAGIAAAAIAVSSVSLYESTRIWGAILLAAFWLSPGELGIARTCLSIAAAMVTVVPVPIYALVSLGKSLQETYTADTRLTDTIRYASCVAALAAAGAVMVYGSLMPAGLFKQYAVCAAGVLVLTAIGPMVRLALAAAAADMMRGRTLLVLMSVTIAVALAAAASAPFGALGFLLGLALGSVPVLLLLAAPLRNRIARRQDVAYLAASVLALGLLANTTASVLMHLGVIGTLGAGYLGMNYRGLHRWCMARGKPVN